MSVHIDLAVHPNACNGVYKLSNGQHLGLSLARYRETSKLWELPIPQSSGPGMFRPNYGLPVWRGGSSMPRYHFNLHDHRYVPDLEGSELADLDAAKRRAVKIAAAILSGQPDGFLSANEWRVEVTDQAGVLIFAVGLTMLLAPTAWSPAGS